MTKPAAPKRKGRGRPKLPKGEAKGRIVPVRFTAKELQAMTARARENGQSISEWVRNVVSAAMG